VARQNFSERTFDRRFAKYRARFEAEDRFSYGRYHFCRNGDIFKAGRRLCNLHDSGGRMSTTGMTFVLRTAMNAFMVSL
jgi:hypothetical protein